MTQHPARSVLSLQGVALTMRDAARPGGINFDLPRGQLAVVQVDDETDASSLIDLCLGLVDPAAGFARFLGVDWKARTPVERLRRRRRIGAVLQADTWPPHMTVLESVLVARTYHSTRPRAELIAEATSLARLFGLPGLPSGRRDMTPMHALVRAACVRGFLGSPELVVVHDQTLDQAAELAVPLAQAITETCDRGGSVLWLTESARAQAMQFVRVDHMLRLDGHRLIRTWRPR